ncbi:ABC transporter ATP-binding protein [Cryptosporangium arvum]|uniref:ABC-type multidrug transport system, ATPase and permease component n=1 Tax=Cryptosporangium arvum DSM 44712 TaxID=927661 RepID=A0A010Z5I7_9ACTN|nr:ABC transporter ATP-binding protein [Cryptosporangium arvum]EXG82613.1 ABC-type multidrug transport system, ATPase and permease component [Cryptosporangium arvum DSM 44712]
MRAEHSLAGAWRTLWPWLRPYRRGLAIMVVADVLSLVAQTVTPFVFARMIDGPIRDGDHRGLWRYAAVLLGLAVLQTVCYGLRRWPTRDSARMEAALRRDLFRRLQRLSALHHDRHGSGQAVSRVIGDVTRVGFLHQETLVFLVSNTVALVVTATMLVIIHPVLGLLVVAAMIPLAVASGRFRTRFGRAARLAQDRTGDLATVTEEAVLGVRVLTSVGGWRFAAARFDRAAAGVRDAELAKVRLNASFRAGLTVYPLAVLSLVVVGGGVAVADGAVSVGSFVAFATLYLRMLFPVNVAGALLASLQEEISAARRIAEITAAEPDVTDPPHPVPLPPAPALSLRLDAVGFSYPGAGSPTLDGVDLDVAAGETVALVGATGSGKTTLVDLVGRLVDPGAGRVLIGGIDVRDLALDELRAAVGIAFEDATLFSATVRDNLVLSREHTSDAELDRVLSVARAEFVHALPDGLDTLVGERGLSLSGGQRQRLTLARALLGRPRLLVLDDPMSALDVRTEETIERRLRAEFGAVTTLLIARRPATARLADRVAVLADRRIVDVGTHAELMHRSAAYRHVLIAAETTTSGPAR